MGGMYLAALVLILTWVQAQSYDIPDWGQFSRRSDCTGGGGRCFSTHECCHSYVCAAYDNYLARRGADDDQDNPEVPGVCVKEKDLRECSSSGDCPSDKACVPLRSTAYHYCVAREHLPPIQKPMYQPLVAGNGRLGTSCSDTAQCMEGLCCQKIRRGRQGTKQMCDRITSISKCLSK
nr:prohormone-3 [Urechis unicinctus]